MAFSFYVLTTDAAALKTQLDNHLGPCPTCGKPRGGPGVEWAEKPNPIITTPAVGTPGQGGYVPPVMDPRRAFVVKFAGEAEAEEIKGEVQDDRPIWARTRFGKAVLAASSAVTLTGNTSQGAFSIAARLTANGKHWLMRSNQAEPIFGGWQ